MMLGLAALCWGCPHPRPVATKAELGGPPVDGVWGVMQRRVDPEGDERTDHYELQLKRDGERIVGFWSLLTTWISKDGRPFRCGGTTRYEAETRSVVSGLPTASGARIEIVRQLPDRRRRAPCPIAAAAPAACDLARRGDRLHARCGSESLTLDLRLGRPIPLAFALGRAGSVTGVWTWHHRSGDQQGDTKTEDETWHLLQKGDRIDGFYDRRVTVRSGDGRRFVCNNDFGYETFARFTVRGRVAGPRLRIKEVEFAARAGACETSKRLLDEYEGIVAPDGSMIHLSWGKGSQLLYRRY